KRTRSVLCVPIVTQTKLVGALYLENNLTPRAFTSDRVTVLELLASQAAISLENAGLYSDLQRGEAFLAEGQNISHTGSFGWNVANGEIYWSAETYNIFEHDRAVKPRLEMLLQRVHADDRDRVRQTLDLACETGANFDFEHRLLMADGSFKHLHVSARVLTTSSEELEYVGAVTDITGAKQAEERLRWSEADLHEAQRMSHTGSWKLDVSSGTVTGSPQMFRLYGVKPDEDPSNFALWFGRSHPEDQKRMRELFERSKIQKTDYDADYRIVLPDGEIKHIHTAGHPVLNESGDLVEFVGTNMDVTERVRTSAALEKALQEIEQRNEVLRASEHDLNLIINTIPALAWSARPDGSADFFNQHYLEFVGLSAEQVKNWGWTVAVHPDDLNRLAGSWQSIMSSGKQGESEARLRRFDGEYRWFLFRADPLRDESGNIVKWFGINTDIEDRKRAEDALRRSEGYLTEAQRLTHTGSWAWNAATSHRAYWSQENYRMFGFDPELGLPSDEALSERIHPEDRDRVRREAFPKREAKGSHFDIEYRVVLPDAAIKHLHSIGHPVLNESGDLVEFVGTTMDITERRQAEEKIREQELELRQIMDAAPQFLFVLGSDGSRLYANQSVLEFRGQTVEEWQKLDFRERFHPDDAERMAREREQALSSRSPFETEGRMLRHDGKYRWFLFRYKPLKDHLGRITRWVVPAIDIDDRKRWEQRLQQENIALREEIDKASMFEEIVGTSPALQTVLSLVSKVAATDSTVLITGETGTGKELVARAIHRRSQRSSFAFVSVNCAAIPRDLIASELFGHEKGSFTGATQRRLGRFELAERGTIFLDEVGELPPETQIALLRVLQEREFERVGGAGTIRTDVRVIAATNRDLEAAIGAGMFRSDLFYRLNVFPIEMPPLRERREDIPMLVEYFIDRYARKAGKTFQAVNKNSLDLLQSYPWPGNIRELQNVIERSVIVCETGTFSVDKSWLSRQPLAKELSQKPRMPLPAAANSESVFFKRRPSDEEKAVIENALRECAGRVYGPSGAAARLGIPRTTLENKIRSLKINKNRFKAGNPTVNN
ncbi:MAG TPA: PAS domain-containing protein, partial [Candidatus Sulfotelmatobacter sp.]